MPDNETFARHLAEAGAWELGHLETRRFPDGESYVPILSDLADRPVTLVCTLARPDDRFLPLAFVAHAARVLGASEATLVALHISPICGRIGASSRANLSALALPHFPASTEPARPQPGVAAPAQIMAQIAGELYDRMSASVSELAR